MTIQKQETILKNASIFYGAFPTDKQTINHRIIIEVCDMIKTITEYKGHTKGAGALPKNYLGSKYSEMWDKLQELEEKADRNSTGYREAHKSLDEAEDLLNTVFMI